MSAATYVETSLVVDSRHSARANAMLDTFLDRYAIRVEPFTRDQARVAREANLLFGKGRHRAELNFGDRLSYALAKVYREPILFKGNDFSKTDLIPADSATL